MVVLPLLYFFYLHNLWAEGVSNDSFEPSSNDSRSYQYYHETLDPENKGAANDFNWRVWGGKSVPITQAPYAVMYGTSCTGVLIAPNWAMTVAHCEKDNEIFVGSEISQNAQPVPINKHVLHPGWSAPKTHYYDFDYQLLELAQAVPVTDSIRPIAISDYLNISEPVLVSGWGHSKYQFGLMRNQSTMSDILNQVSMTVLSDDDCATRALPFYESKFNERSGITPRKSCAEGTAGGSCYGDSGGPVVAHGQLVGLVSWSTHCEPLLMFANVVVVKDWIRDITGLNI